MQGIKQCLHSCKLRAAAIMSNDMEYKENSKDERVGDPNSFPFCDTEYQDTHNHMFQPEVDFKLENKQTTFLSVTEYNGKGNCMVDRYSPVYDETVMETDACKDEIQDIVEVEDGHVVFEDTQKDEVKSGCLPEKPEHSTRSVVNDFSACSDHNEHKIHPSASNYKCAICNSSFTTDTEFKTHVWDVHALKDPVKNTYQCYVCDRIFKWSRDLRRHLMNVHAKVKIYEWGVCGMDFARSDHIRNHAMLHLRENPPTAALVDVNVSDRNGFRPQKRFPCTVCGAVLYSHGTVIEHLKMHAGIKDYKCSICDTGFVRNCELAQHVKRKHGSNKRKHGSNNQTPYQCSVCGATFATSHSLKQHLYSHTGRKPFACNICGNKFGRKSVLRYHISVHTEQRPHKCTFCHATFKQIRYLRRHVRRHNREGRSLCPWCGESFTHIKSHILAKHPDKSDIAGHVCPVCGKAFLNKGYFKQHVDSHNPDREKYACNVCGVRLVRRRELERHLYRHFAYSAADSAVCDVCGRRFPCQEFLKTHMKSHRSERKLKPYICKTCNRAFHDKCQLKSHLLTHTGEKPHKCKVCGLGFAMKGNILQHMRTHTGEKPHKCSVCNAAFARTDNMKQHMRTHTGEKPYTCPVCKAKFARSDNFKRHVMRHGDL